MPKTAAHHCPACNGPTAIRASIRVDYHERDGETYADEVETDALRCANAACRYPFTDLAEVA